MPKEIHALTRRNLILLVIACCIFSLVLQFALLRYGFVAASADESARALIARNLTWDTLLVPYIWPPFYEVVVGLANQIYPDLFYTPRAVSTLFGLMSLVWTAILAWQMFQNRLIVVVAAILAVFLHHRLLLSVAPMSEIFLNFFVIAGCAAVVRFGRTGAGSAFLTAALVFMLSGTVRFEGWMLCAAFVLITGIRQVWLRPLGFGVFPAGAAIACAFPVLWSGLSLYHFGDLSGITAAREQNAAAATELARVIRNSHLSAFVRDFADTALLPGAIAAAILAFRDRPIRLMLGVSGLGLILATLAAIASQSNPLAAPWRIAGAWTSLLIPFTAYALVWVAERIGRAGRLVLPVIVAATCAGLAHDSWRIVQTTVSAPMAFSPGLLDVRSALKDADPAFSTLLIDVDDVEFLHLVVAVNAPDKTAYSTGSDPVGIALRIGQRAFWEAATDAEGKAIYDRYVSVKTDFADGPEALQAKGISHVAVRDGDRSNLADRLDWLTARGEFSHWRLYAVQPK